MRIVQLTTDLREHDRQYLRVQPGFATFSEALLIGFSRTPGIEVHVVSCIKQPVSSPAKLYDNIFFHSLTVPKSGWLRTGYQGCVRAVRRKLREIQPDIVHGQGTERDCAISAVFSGFPNVVTVHGNMRMIAKLHNAKPWSYLGLTAMFESAVLQRAGGIVCNNNYTLGNVRTLNVGHGLSRTRLILASLRSNSNRSSRRRSCASGWSARERTKTEFSRRSLPSERRWNSGFVS